MRLFRAYAWLAYVLSRSSWGYRLDIMEYTAQHLEAGYSKIHKWLAFEARGFAKDVLEVSQTVREAVNRLKNRPELLKWVSVRLGLRSSTN